MVPIRFMAESFKGHGMLGFLVIGCRARKRICAPLV